MIKARIKKSIYTSLAVCWLISAWFASYTDFLQNISQTNIDIEQLQQQPTISRYDLARLLNLVECKDCIHPQQEMIQTYNQEWRSDFVTLPNKDFRDIAYQGAEHNNESYYYCVAYAGDQQYMRWFPQATSPICWGQFCGTNNVTTAELIQVLINIASNYIYSDLELDRSWVRKWKDGLTPWSYQERSLTADMKDIIDQQAQDCPESKCALNKPEQVETYLTYCTFNLQQCKMHSYQGITQGARPVAELNILEKVDILGEEELGTINIHELPTAGKVLKILYRVFGIVDCRFNSDYDCDGIDNIHDTCPNQYNPSQKDFDYDKIGDVCDNDTDNDGITNPIGIIDETNNINIRIANQGSWYDSCLFDPHNKPNCNNQKNYAGLAITVEQIGNTITAQAQSTLDTKTIQWFISDGSKYGGEKITHSFSKDGTFSIKAKQVWPFNTSIAESSVDIAQTPSPQAIQIQQVTRQNNTAKIMAKTDSNTWNIERLINDTQYSKQPNQEITFPLTNKTPYNINASIYHQAKLQATASSFLYKDEEKFIESHITSDTINPKLQSIVTITSYYDGFNSGDIASIARQVNQEKLQEHELTLKLPIDTVGQKIVSQTIVLYNGLVINNRLTLHSRYQDTNTNSSVSLVPSVLQTDPTQPIDITLYQQGFDPSKKLTHIRQTPNETTKKVEKVEKEKVITTFLHHNWGNTVTQTIFKEQCKPLTSQATIAINDATCEQFLQDPALASTYCDRDQDTIPDICDDDIDNDGIKNLIGLIVKDNKDCSIDQNSLNRSMVETNGFIWFNNISCQLDNCPFTPNADQSDVNIDGQGDLCQNMIYALKNGETVATFSGNNHQFPEQPNKKKSDQDNDWIDDGEDRCPTIPEELNGYFDEDGCPELANNPCQSTWITIPNQPDEDYCVFPYPNDCKCSWLSTQQCCDQHKHDCNGFDDPWEDQAHCSYPYGQECSCAGLTQQQCCEQKWINCKDKDYCKFPYPSTCQCKGLTTQQCCEQFNLDCPNQPDDPGEDDSHCSEPYGTECLCKWLSQTQCCDQLWLNCEDYCRFPYPSGCLCGWLTTEECCEQFNLDCPSQPDDPGEDDNHCTEPYGVECSCNGLSQTECCEQFWRRCDNGDYCQEPYPSNCQCAGLSQTQCCSQFNLDCPLEDPTGQCTFPYTGNCVCVGLSQIQCCNQFNINCPQDDPGENDNNCTDPYGAECLCFNLTQTQCCQQFGFDCGNSDYCQEPYPSNCQCAGLSQTQCCSQFNLDCPLEDPTGQCTFPYTGNCVCVGLSQIQCCNQFNINCPQDDPGENDNNCTDPYGAECLCFNLTQTQCCQQFGFDCGNTTGDNIIPDNYITPITCNTCPCQYVDFIHELQKNNLLKTVLRDAKKTIIYSQSESFAYDTQN